MDGTGKWVQLINTLTGTEKWMKGKEKDTHNTTEMINRKRKRRRKRRRRRKIKIRLYEARSVTKATRKKWRRRRRRNRKTRKYKKKEKTTENIDKK